VRILLIVLQNSFNESVDNRLTIKSFKFGMFFQVSEFLEAFSEFRCR
jgi:hypothetical protein